MKELIYLFVIIANLSCAVQSQDSIYFKIQYYPDRIYKTIINQSSETKISYSSLSNNSSHEAPIPSENMNLKTNAESTMVTGSLTGDDYFPFTIKTVDLEDSLSNNQISGETIYYGRSSIDNKITIDSLVTTKEMDDEMKKYLLEWAQNHYSQITYPGKKVTVKDTISHSLPYSILYDDLTNGLSTNTIYLLESINEGIAIFSLEYTLKSASPDVTLNVSAKGKGQMHYDIVSHFYTYFQMEIYSILNSEVAGLNMNMTTTSHFISTTSIKQN